MFEYLPAFPYSIYIYIGKVNGKILKVSLNNKKCTNVSGRALHQCKKAHCAKLAYIYIPRVYKQYCLQLDIALWCENQIEHSIWDESLLFSNCACSLEYSSLSTLAGLSYHICGKLEVAFIGSPSSQHQHCTDEAQKLTFCLLFCSLSR